MVAKRKRPEEALKRGRPRLDPADLRSERLVLRVHPDLMEQLNRRGRTEGISRSLFVERVLIAFLNGTGGRPLDRIGRYTQPAPSPGALENFERAWQHIETGSGGVIDPVSSAKRPLRRNQKK